MPPRDEYRLTVVAEIQRYGDGVTGEQLSLREEIKLPPVAFADAARILGALHDLAERLAAEATAAAEGRK